MEKKNLDGYSNLISATGVIFQLADGTIVSCNTNAESILKRTAEQLIGASLFDLPWQMIGDDGLTLEHPAIVSMKTGQPCFDVTMGFRRANEDLIWLSVDFLPLFLANQNKLHGVEISFKLAKPTTAASKPLPQQLEIQSARKTKEQLTVMLVEDSPEDRETYRRYLRTDSDYQYSFIETESAEEALEMYRQYRPDIVLLDYLLPDMDGLEWLSQWQQLGGNCPLIMLTGQGDENIAVQSLKLGAANYLVKSFLTPEKLKLEVKRAISDFRLQARHQAALIELQKNQQLLRLSLSNSNAGSWDWEIGTGKVIWSPENYDLYGIELQNPLRYEDWELALHPEDRVKTSREVERVLSGESAEYRTEFRIVHPQKGIRWLLAVGNVTLDENSKPIRLSGINLDITDRKRTEAKLQQQTQALMRANQVKDEFLAVVSHELRTPLNPILGWSKLLADGNLSPERMAMGLKTIERNAKLQSQLVDDLLDMSLILRGKSNLKLTPVNLKNAIAAARETIGLAAETKSIQIETIFEPNVGLVLGDITRLQQIIWNLLSNAVKFTPEGGRVTVRLGRVGAQVQIQVKDTGQGIEPEFLPYVFDRFRQEEGGITRKVGGLGLGLALVRYLCELHGGTVAVESLGKRKGATFSVRLPQMDSLVTEPNDNAPDEPAPNFFNGIKVLAIENDVNSRQLLALCLQQRGIEVTSLASAREALEALESSTPNLIICNIEMLEINGYTLIAQIRSLPQGKNIPAIAITAQAGEVDRQHCLDAGFQAHLAKPFDPSELMLTIMRLMQSLKNIQN